MGTTPDGYANAFYDLADIMGIPARTASPKDVWEKEMRPRLVQAFANLPHTIEHHPGRKEPA
jgi:hypothetical protein